MTRVDFYILQDQARDDRFGLACRLAEKAWRQGHRVLLVTADADEARHLDRLLWTYRDGSFVPHGQLGTAPADMNPILVGHLGQDPGEEHDVMVNLATQVPTFFSRFDRVAECVDHDEDARKACRERYKYYKEHGYPLQTHDIA